MTAEPQANEAAMRDPGSSAIPPEELARLTDDIIGALKTVYDPEIPADIYELGLVYRIDIEDDRSVKIDMTLTAPGCPVAGEMPGWVQNAVGAAEGVSDLRSAVDARPHVGRGALRGRLVLNGLRRRAFFPILGRTESFRRP